MTSPKIELASKANQDTAKKKGAGYAFLFGRVWFPQSSRRFDRRFTEMGSRAPGGAAMLNADAGRHRLGAIVWGAVSDSPNKKSRYQEYLLSDTVQQEIQRTGHRTGYKGVSSENADVFRSGLGTQPDRVLSPIRMPSTDVLIECLDLYRTHFRAWREKRFTKI